MASQIVLGGGGIVSATGALTGNGSSANPLAVAVDGVTITIVGDQLVGSGGGGSGTVTSVSVVSANGLAGTVANATTTPAITLTTTITGVLKGNATSISAAVAGTDYVAPGGALGTPSSGTLTNCTGLPISTGVSGLGTGVATALAVNVGSAGAFVTFNGALGTPSSGTLTNCTGLPFSSVTATPTTFAGYGIVDTAANLSTAIGGQTTGSGNVVRATSPTLVTPALGTPSALVLTNATGLVTAGINASQVTLAKIQNAGANSVIVGSGSGGSGAAYSELTLGAGLAMGASSLALSTAAKTRSIQFTINGNGSVITTGIAGDIHVPYACTITGVTLLADASGSIVVDIWNAAFGSYPPTVANTITASDLPTLSSAASSQDTTLTGWTTALAANSTLRYNVNSASTVKRVVVALTVTVS